MSDTPSPNSPSDGSPNEPREEDDLDKTRPPRRSQGSTISGLGDRVTPPDTRFAPPPNGFGDSDSNSTRPLQAERSASAAPSPRTASFGPFQVEEKIGEGGMGIVYRAYDADLHRRVAIKKIHPKLRNDYDLASRFISEARTLASVTHVNIAQIFSIHARDVDTPYFVMEYVEGESAERKVERNGPLDPKDAVDYIAQAARGLRAAQTQGIVHRDVKPSNLVVNSRSIVKVVDFGLSRSDNESDARPGDLTEAGVILGTPYYVSPEQARGQEVDHRSDIYSLGCTLYFLLTGKPPYEGRSQVDIFVAHCNDPIPRPSKTNTGVKPEIDAIVTRALAKDAKDRYQGYDALIADLEAAVAEKKAVPPARRLVRMTTRVMLWSCAALLAVTVATKPQELRRLIGLARGSSSSFDAAEYFGAVYTPASEDDPFERLDYVFADYERLPNGIDVPSRAPNDANVKIPTLLGNKLRWSNLSERILFPYMKEVEEIELEGLKFQGEPDFELMIGYDDERLDNDLRVFFGVFDTNTRTVECRYSGDLTVALSDQADRAFDIKPNTDYTVHLVRSAHDSDKTQFALRIVAARQNDDVPVCELSFEVPTAALEPGGYVSIRCDGRFMPWDAFVSRVLIRGRLDHDRIERDKRGVGRHGR